MKKTFHRIYHNAENFTGTEEDIFSEKCSFSCKFHDYGQNIPRLQWETFQKSAIFKSQKLSKVKSQAWKTIIHCFLLKKLRYKLVANLFTHSIWDNFVSYCLDAIIYQGAKTVPPEFDDISYESSGLGSPSDSVLYQVARGRMMNYFPEEGLIVGFDNLYGGCGLQVILREEHNTISPPDCRKVVKSRKADLQYIIPRTVMLSNGQNWQLICGGNPLPWFEKFS